MDKIMITLEEAESLAYKVWYAKFKSEQSLNFSLLSDFNKDISALYGSLYEMFSYNMKGVSKRSAFVIDKDGIVRYAEVLENASEQPNFKNITLILEGLK